MVASTEKMESIKSSKSAWEVAVAVSRILLNPFLGCAHDFKKVNGHHTVGDGFKYTYRCPVCGKRDFY
jgi:hypothetical protein